MCQRHLALFSLVLALAATAAAGDDLLRPSEIHASGQEYRLDDGRWIVAPPSAGRMGPSSAEQAKKLQEVAFATSARNESLSQLRQAVTALPGGGWAVVWDEGDFPERDVRMQWLAPDGRKLFEPEGRTVTRKADFDETNAIVAPHSEAGVFVAFTRAGDTGGPTTVYVQSFDASGAPRWPGNAVRVTTGSGQNTPYLVPDSDGGVYACWTQGPGGVETIAPRCQHFDRAGRRTWGPHGLLAGGESGLRVVPRGVSDGAGGLLIFWRNQRDVYDHTPEPMLMEGQHFTSAGKKLWGDAGILVKSTRLLEDNGYSYTFYDVVSDGKGGAILAYNDWLGGARTLDVVAQRVAVDGSLPWGDGVAVAATEAHQQHETTIAAPGGGAFVVVFEEVSDTQNKLRLFRLGSNGAHLWSPEGLVLSDADAAAQDYGAFGSFDSGLLQIVWTHQKFEGTFEMDVQLARYRLSGERLGGPASLAITTAPDAQFTRGFAYSPEAKKALTVWEDRRKGTWNDLDTYGSLCCRK